METLQLTWKTNTPAIPVTQSQRLLYLLIQVRGEKETSHVARPVNLALVVDVSESMNIRVVSDREFKKLARSGVLQELLVDGVPAWHSSAIPPEVLARLPRKIDRVKEALSAVVEHLRPDDSFSLTVFAGQAALLIPTTAGAEKRRILELLGQLDGLQLGNDTYIGRGLKLGLEELMRSRANGLARRLLVLTDGFTRDENDCRLWAVYARNHRIPISTLGLGGEFNEELMIPIADQTGGEAHFVEELEVLPAILSKELQRAQSAHYSNVELKLRLLPGVEIRDVHRLHPAIAPLEAVNQRGSYSFQLGSLAPGEEMSLLAELVVPPRPPGAHMLVQALLACDLPPGVESGFKTRANLVVEYTSDWTKVSVPDPQVMRAVEVVSAYKLHQRAVADLRSGDIGSATRRLRAAATRLLDMGETMLAGQLMQQATALELHGQADPTYTKKLRYETRMLSRKLI
ncbi:MAG: VWA domain-containing protein [Anaerolineae bacterium]|nr:VWA domain-containing protein [Anaerolineae bacterium]